MAAKWRLVRSTELLFPQRTGISRAVATRVRPLADLAILLAVCGEALTCKVPARPETVGVRPCTCGDHSPLWSRLVLMENLH